MAHSKFFKEIFQHELAIHLPGLMAEIPYINKHLQGESIDDGEKEPLKATHYNKSLQLIDESAMDDDSPQNAVAVIPIRGILIKYGEWWYYGTDDYAQLLEEAYQDDSIKAVVLQIHSPGGSTHSVVPLEAAIKRRNKPVIAAVDSYTMSAAYYISTLTDKIFAVDRMAEVGSIGVMAQLIDDSKYWEEIWKLKIITIYPPESNWKNKAYNEALEGNTDLLIKEDLSPWAKHFQKIVTTNRPKLDLDVEGIINGREFYAYDAKANGLIDDIMPLDQIIEYAFNHTNNSMKQIFNT